MRHLHLLSFRWLLILTIASLGSAVTAAQLLSGGNGTPPSEIIQIQTGNILEILPIHSFPSATYSWILTQDRNFLEVGRHAFYSTRLINPGRFTLNAEMNDPMGQTVLRRIFTIDVLPRQSEPLDNSTIPAPAPLTPTSLVRTQPEKREDGLIILPPNQVLLLLTPLRDDLRPLHIDLHSQNDTNDDDILTNDIDNAGTFFQTSGTPLYLWFTSPLEQRDITVHARTTDGTALTQALSVLPADYAKQRGLFVSRVQISTEERGPKSLFFSPKFEDSGTPAIPLVFHWDFGDGTESIEEHPLHEYQTYGTYNVHLSIRNIETGQELAARTAVIPLKAPLIQDPNTILPSPSLPPNPPPPPTSFLRTALIILGIAVGFTAIGFIAVWVVHTVKRLLRKRREVPPSPPPPSPPPSSSGSGTPNWLKKGPPTAPPPVSTVPIAPTIPPPKPQQPAPLSPPTPPEPTSPKPATPLPPLQILPPAAPSVPLKVPPPKPPAPPQPKSSPPPPKPSKPATPAPPPLPPPQPTPALPTIQPLISKNPIEDQLLPTPAEESNLGVRTEDKGPPKENIDRTIAIVQADNLQKPAIPPAPPGSQTKL